MSDFSGLRIEVSPWVPKKFTGYRRFRFDWLLLAAARYLPRLRQRLRRNYGEYDETEVYIVGDTIICSPGQYDRLKKVIEHA